MRLIFRSRLTSIRRPVATSAVLFFAAAAGCGGTIATETNDASLDIGVSSDTRALDAPTSDVLGPPSDVGHLPDAPGRDAGSCALMADPCFAQFASETDAVRACLGHPDTCSASGNSDASGCGRLTTEADGTQTCSWSDGALITTGKTSGSAVNSSGALCYKYDVVAGGSGAVVTVTLADGKTFQEIVTSGSGTSNAIVCPDGSRSRSYTSDELTACGLTASCCSSATPARCM